MKLNELTAEFIADYLRISDPCVDDIIFIDAALTSAKAYISNYTGLTAEQAGEREDIVIAALALCQDMYDNRSLYIEKGSLNKTVETVLNMCSVNLL